MCTRETEKTPTDSNCQSGIAGRGPLAMAWAVWQSGDVPSYATSKPYLTKKKGKWCRLNGARSPLLEERKRKFRELRQVAVGVGTSARN